MKFEVNPGPCSQPTRKSNRNPPTIVLPIDDDDDDEKVSLNGVPLCRSCYQHLFPRIDDMVKFEMRSC